MVKPGCHQCQCNGHGNRDLGECHNVTGVCFCQDNTEGDQCDRCKANYYGNPLNGKMCYYQCEARGLLLDAHGQGISSRQAYSAPWSGTPTRECLWIINPIVEDGAAVIQLEVGIMNKGYLFVERKKTSNSSQLVVLLHCMCRCCNAENSSMFKCDNSYESYDFFLYPRNFSM